MQFSLIFKRHCFRFNIGQVYFANICETYVKLFCISAIFPAGQITKAWT